MTSKTFDLDHPFEFNGTHIAAIALRRPKGREVRKMQNGSGSAIDRSFEMMANLAEVEPALFDDMDAADIRKIDAWLNTILGE
jgi:hypothetical protein